MILGDNFYVIYGRVFSFFINFLQSPRYLPDPLIFATIFDLILRVF